MPRLFPLILILLLAVSHAAETPPKYKTQYAVIMVMDGARYTETWGDPSHKFIPNLSGALAKDGVIYANFRNNGTTSTNPGHTALMTGFYQKIENSGKELPDHPSFMQLWLKKSEAPKSAAWVVASKDKLEVLAETTDPEWHAKFNPSTDCGVNGLGSGYRDDEVTYEALMKTLKEQHPRLLLVNFQQPDSAGHAKNWVKYLRGIMDKDQYAAEIWKFLQSDPFYKDKTAFFMTNDHGRHLDGHKDGFVSHGDDCEGCHHIMLFAAGPDFKKNVIEEKTREQIDVPVTIGELLGFTIPGAKGQVMRELFAE